MTKVGLSIVIPFYNEGKQTEIVLKTALKDISQHIKNFEILAVDNGSKDDTGKIIINLSKKDKRIVLVKIIKNIGYGYGVRFGLSKAKGNCLGWIDGDGQFEMDNIIKAYNILKSSNCGLVKGCRISRADSLQRNIVSVFFNLIFNILYFNKVKDINSKPKLITRECFNSFEITSNDWFIDAEIIIKSLQNNFKICEFPLVFKKRASGKSNVKFFTLLEFLYNLIRFRFTV